MYKVSSSASNFLLLIQRPTCWSEILTLLYCNFNSSIHLPDSKYLQTKSNTHLLESLHTKIICFIIIFSAYIGCFIDKDDRMLPAQYLYNIHMTVDMCIQHCRSRGFAYSGVQV